MSRLHRFVSRGPERRLYAESRGTGAPLFLLHDETESARAMMPIVQQFERGFEVISWDMLGHGRSSAPSNRDAYAFEAFIEDALAVLDAFGYESAHWLGHGFGARLTLSAASAHPDRVASQILVGAISEPLGELHSIRVSTLLVVGAKDLAARDAFRAWATQLPKASLYEIEEAGDAVYLDQPEIFSHVVREFLRTAPRANAREAEGLLAGEA